MHNNVKHLAGDGSEIVKSSVKSGTVRMGMSSQKSKHLITPILMNSELIRVLTGCEWLGEKGREITDITHQFMRLRMHACRTESAQTLWPT